MFLRKRPGAGPLPQDDDVQGIQVVKEAAMSRTAMPFNALREHLINVHAAVREMSVSIRQVGVDSPVSSRD
ncbi:hypothetical protein ACF1DV_33565, partial [Streptomyces achromogenes]|uniref:hypothetical protein n=1 Tax=Streptomyces achromogenes TaxID=67255 RepID=UPI0036FF9C96